MRLQAKPFQVLETLVQRPGELITREELCAKLWPSGTFVDFESGLNTAINRLRAALGDSPENPRYIETLPRLGYRFICAVENAGPEVCDQEPVPVSQNPELALVASSAPSSDEKAGRFVSRFVWLAIAVAVFGAAGIVLSVFRGRGVHFSGAEYRPVNLHGASVLTARFLDGSQLTYSTRSNGLAHIFISSRDGSESRVIPITGSLLAVSSRAEFAVLAHDPSKPQAPGHLYKWCSKTGQKSYVTDDVSSADWSPDGQQLAVVRDASDETAIEYPLGKVLFRSQGRIDSLRVSPDGRYLAFWEHPERDDDAGHVRILSAAGETSVITQDWSSGEGLAWDPSGHEIWFTASINGSTRALFTVTRSGRVHKVSNQAASLRVLDVGGNGRILLAMDESRMILRTAIGGKEADISEFDTSHVDDITRDGNTLLFTEAGDFGGKHYAAYTYDRVSCTAKRFASGRGLSLSADGQQALTVDWPERTALTITYLKSGKTTTVPGLGFRYQWARFWKPGYVLVGGAYPGRPLITGGQNIATGRIEALGAAPYLDNAVISADGMRIAGTLGHLTGVFDVRTNVLQHILPDLHCVPVVWSSDGKKLYLLTIRSAKYPIIEFDVATGESSSWLTISPPENVSFGGLAGIAASPDSGAYAYSANVELSRLYVVDGLS